MESVHFVPDQCANFASHFSSIKIFQIDLFYFASHFIRVQIFQICFSLKSEKFLFPPPHYNFGIVHCLNANGNSVQSWSRSKAVHGSAKCSNLVCHCLSPRLFLYSLRAVKNTITGLFSFIFLPPFALLLIYLPLLAQVLLHFISPSIN